MRRLPLLIPFLLIIGSCADSPCRIWLAPSSTSTEQAPKLGLYAGINYEENATIGHPEIAIPFLDFMVKWNRQQEIHAMSVGFLEGYFWTGEYAGSHFEANHSTVVAVAGLGMLANFHSGTHNVDWDQSSVLLRDRPQELQPGVLHPARGAVTPYYNLTMRATQPIKAGMELFANFGEVWDGNHTDDIYQDKLTRWDYMEADRVLDKLLEFMKDYDKYMTPQLQEDVMDFILGTILGTAAGPHAKVIRSLLPSHPGKLQAVKDAGGTFAYRNYDLVKSEKWLEKHGTCMDNLRPGQSTVPEAGRGAFATRRLVKDTIIAPMPMLHIPEKAVMNTYALDLREDEHGVFSFPRMEEGPIGQQLAVNYCYGHPESSLLLLPVGGGVNLLNHKPTDKGANAVLRWASSPHWGNKIDTTKVHPYDLLGQEQFRHIEIVLELVAVRDIEEGEEVFIDYGPEWQRAWDSYSSYFEMGQSDSTLWPLRADDLRSQYKAKPLKTQAERQISPYPEGISTACFVEIRDVEDGQPRETEDGKEIMIWDGPREVREFSGLKMFRCDIVDRSDKLQDGFAYNYTARVMIQNEEFEVKEIPHHAVRFIDEPYMSDIHTVNAFRQPIGFPDPIFPQPWRNLRGQI